MIATVYFADLRARSPGDNTISKIQRLFDAAGFAGFIGDGDLTAIKLHFGERGNDSYVSPVFVRQVVDKVKALGARPFLTDTNTLYSGSRHNAVDHIVTAVEHGFDFAVAGAPLIIADGIRGGHFIEVEIRKKHLDTVKIAGDIAAADSMIVISHFKGHGMAGFGGAIKNLAMGCAPVAGKRDQHIAARPSVADEVCNSCGSCADVCEHGAIRTNNDGKASVDHGCCIGCGECIAVCQTGAIDLDWEQDIPRFIGRLTEYAYGAVKGKPGRVGYINFLTRITPDCDCVPWSDAPIVPDIGILASTDPVAIDAACYDLVNEAQGFEASSLTCHHECGADKFRGVWPLVDGRLQIRYGEEIGLGSGAYRLVRI